MVFLILLLTSSLFAAESPQKFIPTGTDLAATIKHSVFSYNLEVPVVAELERDARHCSPAGSEPCGPIVLPTKTRFIGRAMILKSNNRINVSFYLAVLPDGKELSVTALALSANGTAGIPGKVTKHNDSMVASAALKGAIVGAAAMASGASSPAAGAATEEISQTLSSEVDLGREKVDTSIEVSPYTRCLIYFLERFEIKDEEKSSEKTEARP